MVFFATIQKVLSDVTSNPTPNPTPSATPSPTPTPTPNPTDAAVEMSNIVVLNRIGTGIGPWYYSCLLQNITDGYSVSELCISDDGGATWNCGSEVSWSPYWWVFIGFGKLTLPYDIKITESGGQTITVYDLIDSYTQGDTFDTGTNFGVM